MSRKIFVISVCLGAVLAMAATVSAQDKTKEAPWKTHIELSYVNTSGNTETDTLSGRLEVKKEGEINRYIVKANALYATSEEGETANKRGVEGRWERVFTDRLFGFVTANYSADRFSGYDYRVAGGPGVGYDIVKNDSHFLKGLVSVLYSHDRFSEGADTIDDYAAGDVAITYVWQIAENLKFKENADYLTSFDDSAKYFINSETALEVKVNSNISLGLSYIVAYQNQLPSPDIEHVDTTFLTSLIIDF